MDLRLFGSLALLFLLISGSLGVSGHSSFESETEVDEGSCICGFNKEILDKLQSIVVASNAACTLSQSTSNSNPKVPEAIEIAVSKPEHQADKNTKLDNHNKTVVSNLNVVASQQNNYATTAQSVKGDGSKVEESIHKTEQQEDLTVIVAKLTAEIHRLEAQIYSMKPTSSSDTASNGKEVGLPITESEEKNPKGFDVSAHLGNSGFLGGLPSTSFSQSNNYSFSKLNQSAQVDPQDMTSAIHSTVPNVVSNIFSNIQNLTIQAETNNIHSNENPDKLTSIDGSSVDIKGDTSEEITAESEKLFSKWIEHQLESFQLTASTADYIRKNAISLFRKIVKQYVERMTRIGGSLEGNVKAATQIALNNTQSLISFLMKNYINVCGGMMKLIGEQVSRVGKQLDSTGDTIAHISLNPFDIVSSVMDSLPNPSDYSNYFRNFGKKLIGEESDPVNQQQQDQVKQGGLVKKTMSSLGKTFTSWIG